MPPGVDDAGLPGVVRWQEDVDSTTDHSLARTGRGMDVHVGDRTGCRWHRRGRRRATARSGGPRGAGVRCDDAALEPHHALLVPDGDELRLVQLTGRTPITVGGQPIDGGVVLESPALVEIGHSTLRLRRQSIVARPAAHVRDGVVLRTPRAVPEWAPLPLASPGDEVTEHGRPGGLVPALVGIAAAGVLALVLHQPMFLVFGALGGVVALASWLSQRAGFARRRRRSRRELDRDRAALQTASAELAARYVAHLAEHTSTTASAMATITCSRRAAVVAPGRPPGRVHRVVRRRRPRLATSDRGRRPPRPDAARRRPRRRAGRLRSARPGCTTSRSPSTSPPGHGWRSAVSRPTRPRSRVPSCSSWRRTVDRPTCACWSSPTGPTSWAWFAALPHAASPDGSPLLATPTDVGDRIAALDLIGGPPLVVTTDIPELLASRTSVLRRLVGATESRVALVVLVGAERATPAVCTAELTCPTTARASTQGRARWIADLTSSTVAVGGARRRHRSRRCGTRRRCTARADRPGRSVRRVEPAARARLARRAARPRRGR